MTTQSLLLKTISGVSVAALFLLLIPLGARAQEECCNPNLLIYEQVQCYNPQPFCEQTIQVIKNCVAPVLQGNWPNFSPGYKSCCGANIANLYYLGTACTFLSPISQVAPPSRVKLVERFAYMRNCEGKYSVVELLVQRIS